MLNCCESSNPLDLRVIPDSTWLDSIRFVGKNGFESQIQNNNSSSYSDFSDSEDDFHKDLCFLPDTDGDDLEEKILNIEETPYLESIFRSYRRNESIKVFRKDYLENVQKDFTPTDRNTAIEWMLSTTTTLFLDIQIILIGAKMFDFIIMNYTVPRSKIMLYAATCLFVASKIEEEDSQNLCQQIALLVNDVTVDDIVAAELDILQLLRFNISFITPFMYVEHLFKRSDFEDQKNYLLAKDLIEASLYASILSDEFEHYTSETIAYSAISIAYTTLGLKFNKISAEKLPELNECISYIKKALANAYDLKTSAISLLFPHLMHIVLINFPSEKNSN